VHYLQIVLFPLVGLLVISSMSFAVFKTHAPPGGPIEFGALAAAGAWVRWKSPG
jgi:hypothetical protein